MLMHPAHYFTLEDVLTDRKGGLSASYHLVEDCKAFGVELPPHSIAAPLSGSTAALVFNGQNSFVCLEDASAANAISFWVCPETIDGAQVFLARSVVTEELETVLSVGHRDGRLRITFGAEVWRAADRHFKPGVWTHFALLLDAEVPQIFIDGEVLMSSQVVRPRNSMVDTAFFASSKGTLLLAAEPARDATPANANEAAACGLRRFFDGSIDGLGLWNRDAAAEGLTAAAIRRLASSGPPDLNDPLPPSEPPLAKPEKILADVLPEDVPVADATPAPDQKAEAAPTDDPHAEIWNELKGLVTSINTDEEPPLPVPDLSASVDIELCDINDGGTDASAEVSKPAQPEDVDQQANRSEDGKSLSPEELESEPGVKSDDTSQEETPSETFAEPCQKTIPKLLGAPSETDADADRKPSPATSITNEALASTLSKECGNHGDNAERKAEYALDIPTSETPDRQPEIEEPEKRTDIATLRNDDQADQDQRQRLREALSDASATDKAPSYFRLFKGKAKRDTSLPDLRSIRPRFSQRRLPSGSDIGNDQHEAFCYQVSGAFANSAVDFGSAIRVKLAPDYAAAKPKQLTPPEAKTAPESELLREYADELLFR